jgi:hypothetical protein
MAGNRLYFPVQAVIFYIGDEWDALEQSAKVAGGDYSVATPATPHVAHGVQDVSMTSNFALTPVFEVGQINIYENTEGIPTVEVTLSKVLDGKPLLWHLATLDAVEPTLAARTTVYSTFQLGLWPDTEERCFWRGADTVDTTDGIDGSIDRDNAHGGQVTPIGVITCPKCFPSSLGYTISTTESGMENLTLSGNEKVWARALQSIKKLPGDKDAYVIKDDRRFNTAFADFRDNNDTPDERNAQGYNVMLKPTVDVATAEFDKNGAIKDPDCSVFPIEIPGVNEYGVNDVEAWIHQEESIYRPDPNYARVQSVTINATLTRQDVNALGYRLPVHKSVQMPIQVTSEITAVSTTDDGIQVKAFTPACQNTAALRASTIRLAICNGEVDADGKDIEGTGVNGVRIYAGNQNKLTSVSYGQGGTGGGNVQATYSYQSNNILTVVAKSDPNPNQVPAPAFQDDIDEENYGAVITPGGWWTNRKKWVC